MAGAEHHAEQLAVAGGVPGPAQVDAQPTAVVGLPLRAEDRPLTPRRADQLSRLLRPAERRDDVGDVRGVRPPRARDGAVTGRPGAGDQWLPVSSTPSTTTGGKYSRNRVVALARYVTTRWRVSPNSWRSWWAWPALAG